MDFEQTIARIAHSEPLDFGSIFSRSIELFKKVWLQGFLVLLLTFVLILPFYILLYGPMLMAGITDPEMLGRDEMDPALMRAMIVLVPVVVLGVMTVSTALNAAFLRICMLKDTTGDGPDDYFYYFREGRWKKGFFLGLVILGLSLLGAALCGIGILYFIVPISLMPAFYAFNESLTPIEIAKASFRLGNKNWLTIFGLIIVMGLLAELGVFLCLVGVFFTAMLAKIPTYFIYKDAVQTEREG
ncbi:hypothetical protein [Pseudozobellia thermophila]|uniref:Membrane domain of glycerophosphoryl diester phosphodiesterase n=1 Tax=Pseudozobellia thermophila TaxID=192903 RepID=A0A1M6D7P1_9FLAO|nr:hypothetical protein [Pseudozobellia thermophila]SHI69225.1 hypothetical protein SAMN04488513_1011009 [Pseudozobellia thermophila]